MVTRNKGQGSSERVGASRDTAHDQGADQPGQADRQALPQTNERSIFGVLAPHIACVAPANVVLPVGRLRDGAPLFLESVSTAVAAATAEIEAGLAPPDNTFQQMPVHQHVGI